MSTFTYTARRELTPDTDLLDIVTRQFRLLTNRRSRKPIAKKNTSLSGAVESLLMRSEVRYNCQSELLEAEGLIQAQLFEFLASVENAEAFTFDRRGTIAQPDNPVECVMDSVNFAESERGFKFTQLGFVIRET
jgi:hypothetical protein